MGQEKEFAYSSKVHVGNWFNRGKMEEEYLERFLKQMKQGDLLLARYRKMTENLMTPTILTQSSGSVTFGSRISLLAPYIEAPSVNGKPVTGVTVSGAVSESQLIHVQALTDGCFATGFPGTNPVERNTFIICSADKCDREGEPLKYNQEFMVAISSTFKKEPLYLRYDPDPVPGLTTTYKLQLSKNPLNNCRWRVLPKQIPDLTRFEQEDLPVKINTDVIINHCATNLNLCCDNRRWYQGFYSKECVICCKTILDVYKRETEENLWHIYSKVMD